MSASWFRVGVCAVGLLALADLAALTLASARPGNIDDGFIVLVYARHFAEHGAFYWNEADGVVDGFTSLLDVLVKALGTTLFRDHLKMAFWVTLTAHVLCPVSAWLLFMRQGRPWSFWARAGIGALGALAIASNQSVAYGSAFLLETPLYLLCGFALLAWCLRNSARAVAASTPWLVLGAALAILLALCRPEGMVLAPAMLAGWAFTRRDRVTRRELLLPLGLLASALFALVVWRVHYFGYWAPNTFFAKSSDSRWQEAADGLAYLWIAGSRLENKVYLGAVVLGIPLLWSRWWAAPEQRRACVLVWLTALVSLLTVVWGGGDSYREDSRFCALAFALVAALLVTAAFGLRRWAKVGAVVLLVLIVSTQAYRVRERWGRVERIVREWPLTEQRFRCQQRAFARLAALEPSWSVAQSDCQRFKYFSDRTRVVDLYGLNNRRVAHLPRAGSVAFGKYNHQVGLEEAAPIWIWGRFWIQPRPMARVPMPRLMLDPAERYYFAGVRQPLGLETAQAMVDRYAPASLPACHGRYLNFLVRRDVAERARAAGAKVGY